MTRPPDHQARLRRAFVALDGLSVGDAFGERFFTSPATVESLIAERATPRAPWATTDDTAMAIGIVEMLERCGAIRQDDLARIFARRYLLDPGRGYGGTAHGILQAIGLGTPWREAAGEVWSGMGSMGNGGAMRVAPVGAYFADDLEAVIREARASAEVTHAHPEGQAGAIAVAVAAALAWRMGQGEAPRSGEALLQGVYARTPDGETRDGLAKALTLPLEYTPATAASVLGSGQRVVSWDTVPYAVWCAARHLDDFVEAMWTTVSGLGDRDTTCAIAGGIVVLSAGAGSIPEEWRAAREPVGI
jgi:ADP-ribosylglycohydrolase